MPSPDGTSDPIGPVALTGATGFVGRHLLAALLQDRQSRGLRVRCLVRDPARVAGDPLFGATECIPGDLDDREALERLVDGAGTVVHLAGATRALSRAGFFRANAEGTRRLVEAARERAPAGARFVYVSSLAAAGPSTDGSCSAVTPQRARPRSSYGASKSGGEVALASVPLDALDWVVLRPPVVYGRADAATRLLFRQACAPLVVAPAGRAPLSLIHVDDLVAAIRRAMDPEVGLPDLPEQRFLPLEGPDRSDTASLFGRIALACGRRRPGLRLPLPGPVVRLAGRVADVAAGLTRRPGYFGSDKVRDLLAEGWVVDPAPIRRHLDWSPSIPLDRGLADVAAGREG